jgi:hypothetical protein
MRLQLSSLATWTPHRRALHEEPGLSEGRGVMSDVPLAMLSRIFRRGSAILTSSPPSIIIEPCVASHSTLWPTLDPANLGDCVLGLGIYFLPALV